ncbi:MAG: AAA family ATPase [Clostridia bacterium]|nr:AAA family ATPase [Clostridia bacterium]
MNVSHKKRVIERVLSLLPSGISSEIMGLSRSRAQGTLEIREIRLRCNSKCTVAYKNEILALQSRLSPLEAQDMLERLSEGSLYAHRDNIINGYIPLCDGVRVGLCGRLGYEGGRAIGVSDVSSFVFRIPSGECEFSSELLSIYSEGGFSGMLIYSPPGVGKTTALRSLALSLGSGRYSRRVCVVDQRCEFLPSDYENAEVDILSGYKKRDGIEIAVRTMSPSVVMIDEVGPGEAESLCDVVRCGVPIVATAHARSVEELYSRGDLSPLIRSGVFNILVGISHADGRYRLTVDRV